MQRRHLNSSMPYKIAARLEQFSAGHKNQGLRPP